MSRPLHNVQQPVKHYLAQRANINVRPPGMGTLALCATLRNNEAMTTATQTRLPVWTLGDRLAKARRTANMGSAEMAGLLDVSRTTISNYEAGRTEPTAHVLRVWSEVTGVPVAWLLDMGDEAEVRSRCFRDDAQLALPIDPDGQVFVPSAWSGNPI